MSALFRKPWQVPVLDWRSWQLSPSRLLEMQTLIEKSKLSRQLMAASSDWESGKLQQLPGQGVMREDMLAVEVVEVPWILVPEADVTSAERQG